ncbi:MAG: hypothetical protein WCN98_10830 [Verrucomicrobiaceae bacterium]
MHIRGGCGARGAEEITLNAIHAGSVDADPAKWRVTQAMLERETEKARAAKQEHEGKGVIGFGV